MLKDFFDFFLNFVAVYVKLSFTGLYYCRIINETAMFGELVKSCHSRGGGSYMK